MQVDIKNQKNRLRKDILNRRNSLNTTERELNSKKILKSLIELNELKNAEKICIYVSKGSEADTFSIIEQIISMDKLVYAPKSDIKSNLMTFYRLDCLNELSPGAFSVLEPSDKNEKYVFSYKSDICIVPALSFDKKGFRLGYGKGYYDRFLKDFLGVKIGICFDEFITDSLPKFDTDIAVDMIVTENKKYICKGGK